MATPALDENSCTLSLLAIETLGSKGQRLPNQLDNKNLSMLAGGLSSESRTLLSEKTADTFIDAVKDVASHRHMSVVTDNKNYDLILVSAYDEDYYRNFEKQNLKASARQLRAARLLLSLSIDQLSKSIDVSRSILFELENDGIKVPAEAEEDFRIGQLKVLRFYTEQGVHFFGQNPTKNKGEAVAILKGIYKKSDIRKRIQKLNALKIKDIEPTDKAKGRSFGDKVADIQSVRSRTTDVKKSQPKTSPPVTSKPSSKAESAHVTELESAIKAIEERVNAPIHVAAEPTLSSLTPREVINPPKLGVWYSHPFTLAPTHLKMARSAFGIAPEQLEAVTQKELSLLMSAEQRGKIASPEALDAYTTLIEWYNKTFSDRFEWVPAITHHGNLQHGEGFFLKSELSDSIRFLKSIEIGAALIGIRLTELLSRARINRDVIDLWSAQVNNKDSMTLYADVLEFLTAENLSKVIDLFRLSGIRVFITHENTPCVGVVYMEPQTSTPIESPHTLKLGLINRAFIKEMLKPTHITKIDESYLMSPAQFWAALGLLNITPEQIIDHAKHPHYYKDVNFPELHKCPEKIFRLTQDELSSWAQQNIEDWKKLHNSLSRAGVYFYADTHREGVVLSHSGFDWMQAHISNRILTAPQIKAARLMLFMSLTDFAVKSDVERQEMTTLEEMRTGLPLSNVEVKRALAYLMAEGIHFVRPSHQYGEGVLLDRAAGDELAKRPIIKIERNITDSDEDPAIEVADQEHALSDEELDAQFNGNLVQASSRAFPPEKDVRAFATKLKQPATVSGSSTNLREPQQQVKEVHDTISGTVFLLARLLAGVTRESLVDDLEHKYSFIRSLEGFDEIDIEKQNMVDMINYLSMHQPGLEILGSTDTLGGTVIVDKSSISREQLTKSILECLTLTGVSSHDFAQVVGHPEQMTELLLSKGMRVTTDNDHWIVEISKS
jgi:DNA-binding XRE family transcriptional regulator